MNTKKRLNVLTKINLSYQEDFFKKTQDHPTVKERMFIKLQKCLKTI